MATESTLWDWLKKARDYYGHKLHMRRVENGVSVGDPDTDGVLDGAPWTLELKVSARPRGDHTRLRYHEVTVQQVEWHERRLEAGGATGFLIQVGDGKDAIRYAVHGRYAQNLAVGVTEVWLEARGIRVDTAAAAIAAAIHFTP